MVRTVRRTISFSPNLRQKSSRQHCPNYRLKSIYFNHPSQDNSPNYYIILGPRDKATHMSVPSDASEVSTPSSIFIFISSSCTGELSLLSNNQRQCSPNWANSPRTCRAKLFGLRTVRSIHRTRFAELKFAQIKSSYVRRTFSGSTNTRSRFAKQRFAQLRTGFTFSITVWSSSACQKDKVELERTVRTASKIIGSDLNPIASLHSLRSDRSDGHSPGHIASSQPPLPAPSLWTQIQGHEG